MSSNSVTITDNRTNTSYEFPIIDGTKGSSAIDISKLHEKSGLFTYDAGLANTATCKSDITYIDGKKGELAHRGYDIAWLAQNKRYLDVVYLLLYKKLPTSAEFEGFKSELKSRSYLNEKILRLFESFPDTAHPMAILQASIATLSAYYKHDMNFDDIDGYMELGKRLIAKVPTLVAFSHRHSQGYPPVYPDLERGFTENFLYMMRAFPHNRVELREIEVKALDTVLMLHADHEQNASTTTVRTVGSTHAHPYACISAGIGALWGHAHGGANESVIKQLEMMQKPENVEKFIARAKDKNDNFRLMGFGHRVYKTFDPRAQVLKKLRDDLIDQIGFDSNLIKIAARLEEIVLQDEYFVSRNLYPNVDFNSGIILKALGIPNEMFASIFVMGRVPGWFSQWIESKTTTGARITRPRQIYTGN